MTYRSPADTGPDSAPPLPSTPVPSWRPGTGYVIVSLISAADDRGYVRDSGSEPDMHGRTVVFDKQAVQQIEWGLVAVPVAAIGAWK